MAKNNHIIIEIPEAELDFSKDNWKELVKKDFQEIQNTLENRPNPSSPAYYTWFWFFMRYGKVLCSDEGKAYLQANNLNPFTFVKDIVGLTMSGGGAYTIGYKFFEECLNNKLGIDSCGIKIKISETCEESSNHQIIYYGAPGTGKSHKIKEQLEGVAKENIFRTTFHPDSDYSTFVGAYKPTRSQRPLYGLFGKETVRLKDGEDLSEDIITYKFIPQAFLNAYMQAYRRPDENVYLIIEEINRGNCAQIFGDLFQLLDRDEYGVSEYTIKADADLKAFLEDEMGEDNDAIKDGELCLPSNLYIYATMNTSDQSLFPIDSAFKRRWDWEYEPIKYKNTNWVIDIKGETYSWVSFQKEINRRIFEATSSEDKMLGDYFVNPSNGIITEKMLLNKILFYLWNDVCKDGEGDIFKVSETEDISFSELYDDGGKQKLVDMMNYLGVELVQEDIDDDNENDDENEVEDSDKTDSTRYSINGEVTDENDKAWRKGALVKRAVEIYCQNNSELSANEVRDNWINVGFKIPHIVETDEDRERRINTSKDDRAKERSKEIKLPNGESLHVSTQVGDGKKRKGFTDFLSKIKSKPEWGIDIQEL